MTRRHVELPLRFRNLFSRRRRCSNSSISSLSRSLFSIRVKISFRVSRQSVPSQSFSSSFSNNDRTLRTLPCLSSAIFPLQIETSRSRSFSSSSTRTICSSKLWYSSLFVSNFSTSSRRAHSFTPFNVPFNKTKWSGLRNPLCSNSPNNEKVKVFRYSFSETIPIFFNRLKSVLFSLSDRYKMFTSNWLWIDICENVVLSKIGITMTTMNKKLWNW